MKLFMFVELGDNFADAVLFAAVHYICLEPPYSLSAISRGFILEQNDIDHFIRLPKLN